MENARRLRSAHVRLGRGAAAGTEARVPGGRVSD
jgi:hypothetical protein